MEHRQCSGDRDFSAFPLLHKDLRRTDADDSGRHIECLVLTTLIRAFSLLAEISP